MEEGIGRGFRSVVMDGGRREVQVRMRNESIFSATDGARPGCELGVCAARRSGAANIVGIPAR